MTFAEILIFFLVLALFFFVMTPLRRRLEARINKAFRIKSKSQKKPVDIPLKRSDYSKKENTPNE
jgi:hypothetical protein